ncbi:hypothetical protein HRI_002117800 [Hibiscus trionum]|uniref:Uncharacterized protein n=1 Tax=Hibiscus trionum TaxID=183268 RepID=A0A9W7M3G0_HIBTR|nr:hypothetical protein HRI_002117800 [Hibiscus trionum]
MNAIPWWIIFFLISGLLISNSNAIDRETKAVQASTLDDISSPYFSYKFHVVSARVIRPRRRPPPPPPQGNFIVHQLAPPPSNPPPPPPPKGNAIVHRPAPPPKNPPPPPPPPCA